MSLWTPDGEHEVNQEESTLNDQTIQESEDINDVPGFEDLTPEQQEQARTMAAELAEARQRLAETPASEVVANHVMGIYELAAIHLSSQPPGLDAAEIAIDAMTAILSSLENRLGQNEAVLRDALQQIQMAYVQIRDSLAVEETKVES
ncbi:MAG: hypothetical protein QF596_01140 [Acidimicrobiales bacterium]|jgi:uncharacterized phage infection (PIP) family protein YhgE|nr:hypothetical protein [Acidimicrobiales bacterium]MDP6298663.1 hypothetical protein [Acidimicrobiales bacterium]HJM28857.1 hypothetical protein [Acidimicrobiales bacterium]HJM98161.1 hypothetical protein [Acidimicrobiales bacterium]